MLDAHRAAAGEEEGGAPEGVARLVDEREALRRVQLRRVGARAADVPQRGDHRLLVLLAVLRIVNTLMGLLRLSQGCPPPITQQTYTMMQTLTAAAK